MSGPAVVHSDDRPRVVLTLGKFDGVHLGHRHLVARLIDAASARNSRSAVLVLHPDPVTVLTGRTVPLLTAMDERLRRIGELGVDVVEPLLFDAALSQLSPDQCLDRMAARFEVAGMVVGPNFAFGRGRAGDVRTLEALGRARGFDVVCAEPVMVDGEPVSSRRIRKQIDAGDIAAARALLGASPRLVGTVVEGARRGRTLGFPTANLALAADYAVPGHGIYTVRVAWEGAAAPPDDASIRPERWREGVASIGVRPTFDNGPRSIEVFVLDFEGDLYGRRMTVEFLAWQRGEERFGDVADLLAQMHRDVAVARANLAAER